MRGQAWNDDWGTGILFLQSIVIGNAATLSQNAR